MPQPSVAIIIVNYRGKQDTLECLASLASLTYPRYSVYLVDQASGDNTPLEVRKRFPEVRVMENPVNDGFAGGNNIGIQAALADGCEYIFLLNNDTTVAPDLLDALVARGEAGKEIGIIGALMLYHSEPDIVWSAGGEIGRLGESRQLGQGLRSDEVRENPQDLDFVVGCGLMVKRAVLEQIGVLDDAYFLYYEETDFCARARRAGWRIVTEPSARLWHKVSRTTGAESELTLYYMRRNVLRYLARNAPDAWRSVPGCFLDSLYLAAVWLVRGRRRRSLVLLRALWDAITGAYGKARFTFRPTT